MDDIVGESATHTMQDATSKVEELLYGSDTTDELEETTDETIDDAEELPDDDNSDDDDEGSEDNVDDQEMSLADYLGVDEDRIIVNDDGNVMLNTIVDGETKAVPLSELTKSYQLQGHVNNKSIALEEERKQFNVQIETASTHISEKVKSLDALGQVLEDQLLGEYDSIDWDRLRNENPAEWTALRHDYSERAQKIQEARQYIVSQASEAQQGQQRSNTAAQQAYLAEQSKLMMADNPTWSDPKARQAGQAEIRSYLSGEGYSDAEMEFLTDHRQMRIIQDAMAYRNGAKSAAKKQVKDVPRFQKPGASKKQISAASNARSVKAKRAAVRQSGSVKDAANLLLDRM